MRFGFPGGGGGGGGAGITRVANQAARLLITPATDGFTVLQLDTDEIYAWDLPTTSWRRLAGPQLAFTFTDTASVDMTYNASTQALQADLKLSAAAASPNNLKVDFLVNTDGLFAQIPFANNSNTGVLSSAHWVLFDQARQDIDDHLDGAPGKHQATEISFAPVGNIASTDVQAAIAELDSETDTRLDALELVSHVPVTVLPFSLTANSAGLSITGQQLTLHAANNTNPGAVSTTTQTFGGDKTFTGNVIGEATFRAADGVASIPTYVFINEPGTGLYRIAANTLGVSINGTGRLRLTSAGMNVGSVSPLNDSEALAISLPGSLKLGSATNAQVAAWTTIQAGAMVYNSTELQANVYVNSGWQHIGGKLRLVASDPLLLTTLAEFNGNPFFRCMRRVAGNGAPVVASVSRTNCVDGMELYIVGTSDTNTVTLEPDSNLAINGSITLGNGDTLQLVFDGAANIWREFGRSD